MLDFLLRRYTQIATLQGSRDAVLSLAFSSDAKFIVVCGYDGVWIYNLTTFARVPSPSMPSRSAVSKHVFQASGWLLFERNEQHVVILGSLRGDLLLWAMDKEKTRFETLCCRLPEAEEGEEASILSIDVHCPIVKNGLTGRIAVASRSDISVWTVGHNSKELTKVFQVPIPQGSLPRTVKFTRLKEVIVFCKYGGQILRLHAQTGEQTGTDLDAPYVMGTVCMHENTDRFVAWIGKNLYEVTKFTSMERIRTLDAGPSSVAFPKQASFVEEGRLIAVGSDRGYAVLFNTSSGKKVQSLRYPGNDLVQPIATSDQPRRHLVAIAGSALRQPASVAIFEHKRRGPVVPHASAGTDDFLLSFNYRTAFYAVATFALMATSYFMYRTYEDARVANVTIRFKIAQLLAACISWTLGPPEN